MGSSQFGSQSDILSVNSLDELDISRDKAEEDEEEEEDPYAGFVPEPTREVSTICMSGSRTGQFY